MARLFLLLALLLAFPAKAADYLANPATLPGILERAESGDTIRLTIDRFDDIRLPERDFAEPVRIDARRAIVRSLQAAKTAGWEWYGGQFRPDDKAVLIRWAKRISVTGARVEGGRNAFTVVNQVEDVTLRGNVVTLVSNDGFVIAGARRVELVGNSCIDFRPAPGAHADCVQMWSWSEDDPTEDVTIVGTVARGEMQGITHFWHEHLGRPPVRRVRVTDSDLLLASFHGITLQNVEGAEVRGNRVRGFGIAPTVPPQPFRARIRVDGTGIVEEGNR